MIKLEPLTADLYRRYDGSNPPASMRGFAAVEDGIVLGIAGVLVHHNIVIVDVSQEMRGRKRDIVRAWKKLSLMLTGDKPYYAVRDSDIDTSHTFLTHFGFEHLHEDIYIYRGS